MNDTPAIVDVHNAFLDEIISKLEGLRTQMFKGFLREEVSRELRQLRIMRRSFSKLRDAKPLGKEKR